MSEHSPIPRRAGGAERINTEGVRSNAELLVSAFSIASRRLPACPVHGEYTIPHPVHGEPQRIRALCPCQSAEVEAKQKAAERDRHHFALVAKYGKAFPSRVHSDVTMAEIDDRPAKAEAKAAAERFLATWPDRRAAGDGLFFLGDKGTGKSMLAAAICNALEARRYFTAFFVVADFHKHVRDHDRSTLLFEMVAQADLVVIDDFGEDAPTEYTLTELFRLVDLCFREKTPVIVTSNLGREALESHYIRAMVRWGVPLEEAEAKVGRIISRFKEICASIAFVGDDQREEKTHPWLEGGT
jgi:DNA replication protein DnaC